MTNHFYSEPSVNRFSPAIFMYYYYHCIVLRQCLFKVRSIAMNKSVITSGKIDGARSSSMYYDAMTSTVLSNHIRVYLSKRDEKSDCLWLPCVFLLNGMWMSV